MSLSDWLDKGWLVRHRPDHREIKELLSIADRDIADAQAEGISTDTQLSIAYNAALQLAVAALAAAHSGLKETRRALQALRASPLDDLGLALAISTVAKDAAERANLALELSITESIPALSPDVEQSVYRVAQEAIANVVSHADAKKLTVKLEFLEGKMTLIVEDDGIGFDIEKVSKKLNLD